MCTKCDSISVMLFTEDSRTWTETTHDLQGKKDEFTIVITNDMFSPLCFLHRHRKTSEDFNIKISIQVYVFNFPSYPNPIGKSKET